MNEKEKLSGNIRELLGNGCILTFTKPAALRLHVPVQLQPAKPKLNEQVHGTIKDPASEYNSNLS